MRDRFVANNGCAATDAPEPEVGSLTHIKTEYTCDAGFPVTWIAFVSSLYFPLSSLSATLVGPANAHSFLMSLHHGSLADKLLQDGGHTPAPWDGGEGDNGSESFVPDEAWAFFNQF